MGTHPIFESDFDCLTEMVLVEKKEEVLVEEKKEELPEQKEIPQDVADDDDDDEEEEDELVDPIDALRIACSQDAESRALLTVLNECTERVESREMTEETCQQEIRFYRSQRPLRRSPSFQPLEITLSDKPFQL